MTAATRCFAFTGSQGQEIPWEPVVPIGTDPDNEDDGAPAGQDSHANPDTPEGQNDLNTNAGYPPCTINAKPLWAGQLKLPVGTTGDINYPPTINTPPYFALSLTNYEANTPQITFQHRMQHGGTSRYVDLLKIKTTVRHDNIPSTVITLLPSSGHWDLTTYEFASGQFLGAIYNTTVEPTVTLQTRVEAPSDNRPRIAYGIGYCQPPTVDSILSEITDNETPKVYDGLPISEATNRSNWGESVTRAGYAQPNRTANQRFIVVHTTEQTHGENLNNDKPMLAHLDFEATRETNGGYHYVIQAKDTWQLARPTDWRVYGACALGTNNTGIHVSFACYSHNFNLNDNTASAFSTAIRNALLSNFTRLLGYLSRDFDIPLVYRTRSDVIAGKKGITAHGEIQPETPKCAGRSDPGAHFPWGTQILAAQAFKDTLDLGAKPYRNRGGL